MELASVDISAQGFCLNGECPHCHSKAAFVSVAQSLIEHLPPPEEDGYRMVGALRCVGCNGYILGLLRTVPMSARKNRWIYEAHYPVDLPDDLVSGDVPQPIRDDFREALRCRPVARKATVLMCRRALQTSCDLERADGKDLFSQIDDLAAKQRITGPLKTMAHRIRLLGKKGAHGDYSDIDDTITEKDADDAITFMRHYLDHVYVLPAKLKE